MPFRGPGAVPRFQDVPEVAGFELEQELARNTFAQGLQAAALQRPPSIAPEHAPLPAMHPAEADARGDTSARRALGGLANSFARESQQTGGPDARSWDWGPSDAEAAGTAQGDAEGAAAKAKYRNLQQIPGISQKQAARLTYGRTGLFDDPDPSETRMALEQYTREPTRENAARAVRLGADAHSFPDRFLRVRQDPRGGEMPARPEAPVRGTPEYYDAYDREQGIQTRYNIQENEARSRTETAAQRARSEETEAAAEAWYNMDHDPETEKLKSSLFQRMARSHPEWRPTQVAASVRAAIEGSGKMANLQARTGAVKTKAEADSIALSYLKGGAKSDSAKRAPIQPATRGGVPQPNIPGTGEEGLSDEDLWDLKVFQGLTPVAASAYVHQRKKRP